MKRIATGLLFAAGYANAWSFEEINGLRGNVIVPTSVTPMADPTVKHCSDAHCTEIGAVLTDTCKKNNWSEGHVVMLFNLKEKETCYCNCPATFNFEGAHRIGSFIPDEEAEAMARERSFRPLSDEESRRWAEDTINYHKNFFPEVQFHLDWKSNTVNAYAQIINGVRHVTILGGLVRLENMRPEGLALVLAHELAHHFGGEPFYPGADKMSCEGQADWAGVRDLMRKVWWGEHYVDITRKAIPQMASFFKAPDTPEIPDVPTRGCNHPLGPCRIGTYYAALTLEHEKPKCAI